VLFDQLIAELRAKLATPDPRVDVLAADVAGMKGVVNALATRVDALEKPPIPSDKYNLNRPLFDPSRLELEGGWRLPSNLGGTNPTIAYSADGLAVRENADGTLTMWSGWGGVYEWKTLGPLGTGDPKAWPLVQGQGPADRAIYQKVKDWDENTADPGLLGVHYRKAADGTEYLYVSGLSGYASPVPSDPFIVRKNLTTGEVEGPFGLPGGLCQVYGGGLFSFPKAFAEDHLDDMDLGVGRGRYQSGQGSTAGYSAAAVRESGLAAVTNPADFCELIRFGDFGTMVKALRERRPPDYSTPVWGPEADGLLTPEPEDDIGYCATDRTLGDGFFIDSPTCHGLCNFVLHGIGPHDYKRQTETFGETTKVRLYVYDPAGVARSAKGEILPSQVKHVWHDWELPIPGVTDQKVIAQANKNHRPVGAEIIGDKLYVLYRWAWGGQSEWWPVVARYKLK
jgi:hypothetical protein